jgi:4-hydroxy-3-methylbut-2-en-1-yl diphosphate reductase
MSARGSSIRSATGTLLLAAPMRIEARLVASGAPRAHVHRTGIGPRRAILAASRMEALPGEALVVLGFCGALGRDSLQPGEVVVAERVYSAADEGHEQLSVPCEGAGKLAAALRTHGVGACTGEIVCVGRIAVGQRRQELYEAGALAVEMESAWLARAAAGRPFAVVRVVLDTPERELFRPGTAPLLWRAGAVLRRSARVLQTLGASGALNTMLRAGDVGGGDQNGTRPGDVERQV